jgi:DNA-binding LacI/PurR family transcriptional regulator
VTRLDLSDDLWARATSADVAALAGVSRATVSLVLNDRADEIRISAETRLRVTEAAAQLAYSPNHAARSLRRRRTNVLAFVLSSLDSIYNAEVVSAAHAAAHQRGYSLNVMSVKSRELETRALALLQSGVADGAMITAPPSPIISDLKRLASRGIPVVVLQHHSPDPAIPAVRVDLETGGHLATRHLIGLGHKRIAHIGNELQHLLQRKDRTDGYKRALEEAGIPLEETLLIHAETSLAGGCEAMHALLDRASPLPTAVFVYNDQMAVGALHALRARGLRVPQDVAVVGFDGIVLGKFVSPEITTVDHSHEELGRIAAETLADLLSGEPAPSPERVLPVRLVMRQSCGGRAPGPRLRRLSKSRNS